MLNYEFLTAAVDRAAAIAVSKFPAHHDISDVKQEMWMGIMERKESISELVRKSDGSDKLIVDLLVKMGMQYLKKEDAQVYGYDEEDSFNFSVDLIKSILEIVFKHEDWQSMAQAIGDGMPRAKSEPATAGNNLASYADVSRAVAALPEDQYNTVMWRYKYGYTFQQIGDAAGITKQGAENRHRAAVNSIQQFLGKKDLTQYRRGYSGRTQDALTRGNVGRSATAQAVVEHDYEGW